MKKLLFFLILVILSGSEPAQGYLPFAKPSKHHTIKRMTRKQVKNAAKGKTLYFRNM